MSIRRPAAAGPPRRRPRPSLLAAALVAAALLLAPAPARAATVVATVVATRAAAPITPAAIAADSIAADAVAPEMRGAVPDTTAPAGDAATAHPGDVVPAGRLAVTDDAAPAPSADARPGEVGSRRGAAARRAGARPVSSDLAEAKWAVDSLDNFTPRGERRSMLELQRTPNGGFVIQPGFYRLDAQSYAVHVHALAPSSGSAHLYAPLMGAAEDALVTIARNSVQHPELPQRDVQQLVWAIVARAKFEELPVAMKETAARLLTPRQLANLNRSASELVPGTEPAAPAAVARTIGGRLPGRGPVEVDPAVVEAEARIRAFLVREATATPFPHGVLRRLAMPSEVATLPGPYEPRVVRGRWSLHPAGYYVRYFVERHDWTRVEIWVPQGSPAVGAEFDPATHVAVPANLAAQAILLSAREQQDLSPAPEPGTSQPMPPPPGTATGSRPPTSGNPAPSPPGTDPYVPPSQTPPAPPPPATSSGSPVVDGRFQPMKALEARIDGGGPARDGMLHFLVTLRNTTSAPQSVNISGFSAILTDADGLGVGSSTLYKPDGDPPASFDRSPTLLPNGELKVRFVVRPIEGGAPLQRLTVRENGSSPATFDVSPIVVAGRSEALPTSVTGASATFKPLGDFDVRFDGMQAGRDGRMIEAFVTFRNVTSAVQTVPIGVVRLMLADASGVGAPDWGQLWPVRGIRGKALMQSVRVEPGGEARLRYAFREGPSTAATQVSITYGATTQVFPLAP